MIQVGSDVMKFLNNVFAIGLIAFSIVSLTGCDSVSASLDKNDVKLADAPSRTEFSSLPEITYQEYSRYVTYTIISEAMINIKMTVWTISNSIISDTIAIATKDNKTGERIGASKTKLSDSSGLFNLSGNQSSYIRGGKSYIDTSFRYTTGTNSVSISDKYHMDLPEGDERGVGTFFNNSSADPNNAGFVSPYTLIEELKEGCMIEDATTVIRKARVDGITYYNVEFGNLPSIADNLTEVYFVIAMNGKKFYGMRYYCTITDPEGHSSYLHFDARPFTGTLEVPYEFTGYEKTLEEYMEEMQRKIMEAYR